MSSIEFYTPGPYVEAARAVMGGIDLDPASCAVAQTVVEASAWYGEGSPFGADGLAEPWIGKVLLNPPGGRIGKLSAASVWWDRLVRDWRSGDVEQAIFIGFNLEILRTSQWCARGVLAFPICVPKDRICFDAPTDAGGRQAQKRPPRANVIAYLPRRMALGTAHDEISLAKFEMVFGKFGQVRI